MLNTNQWYYRMDEPGYWDGFNKPWLDHLVTKKADVVVLSDKSNNFLKYTWKRNVTSGLPEFDLAPGTLDKVKTAFGREIDYMDNLVRQGKYAWDEKNGVYKYLKD